MTREALYLDANASVPASPEALAALAEVAPLPGNPSSPHATGRALRRRLDQAREQVAAALGGAARDVVFTSGASEGNRWLIDALRAHATARGRALHVVTSPLEHPSLTRPLARAVEDGALVVRDLPVDETGAVATSVLAAGEPPDAVLLTAAHNETGIVPGLAALIDALGDDTLLACDAAQATGRLPPLPPRVDVVIASAHKMGGVPGAGAALVRGRARELPAPWQGGGQEEGRRPGTEALALLAAFGAAAAVVEGTRATNAALAPLRDRLEAELSAAWGARVLGAGADRLPNTAALVVPEVDPEGLRMAIDLAGVSVGFGSACSALAPEASPALLSFGLDERAARATVRLSLAPGADAALVDEAIARLAAALPR